MGSLSAYGARLIPLGELGDRIGEVPHDRPVVVYCRSGKRSLAAAQSLAAAGIGPVSNLEGGILAWAREVEPELAVT